ncbi:predicted protein [Sclerotinia sclerotiorum 1980 UF-70]|uniref:Uncharacterized protein n=1 Tax=Sclerotinia sclerotiorum (strain ATCC 18683 / 1980 / Ss-1) TaxID=665079 RepID=A7EE32_SCLS1|nr:predicted protein [Sclerotinia sclerotiorum 1980 UF-70]EDO01098.1 predicted protein [Sclerotinia sclerotiorum 1980 UF-70]
MVNRFARRSYPTKIFSDIKFPFSIIHGPWGGSWLSHTSCTSRPNQQPKGKAIIIEQIQLSSAIPVLTAKAKEYGPKDVSQGVEHDVEKAKHSKHSQVTTSICRSGAETDSDLIGYVE